MAETTDTQSTEKVLARADKVLKRKVVHQNAAVDRLARIEQQIKDKHVELEDLLLARIQANKDIDAIGSEIDDLEIAVSIATEEDLSYLAEDSGDSEDTIRREAIRDIIGQTSIGGLKALSGKTIASGF